MKEYVSHSLINPNVIERRDYQEAIARSAMDKNTLVVLPTGLGKCHGFEDLILLENGQTEYMGELVEKALASSPGFQMHNGSITLNQSRDLRVVSFTEHGIKATEVIAFCKFKADEIIEVETEAGISVRVTPEHLILGFDKDFSWVSAAELKLKDWVAIPNKISPAAHETRIDFCKVFESVPGKRFVSGYDGKVLGVYCVGGRSSKDVVKPVDELTPELARFLGLITAEARLDGGINFYNEDEVILKDFEILSRTLFGLETTKIDGGLHVSSTALIYFLRSAFGITNCHSRDKIVPKAIMRAPAGVVSAFICGLYDGDGSVRKDGLIEFMTASKRMAQALPYLLLRFGIVCRVRPKKSKATNSPNPKERTYYRINIEGKENLKLFEDYIGFKQPERKERLARITKSAKIANTNVDVLPVGKILGEIRKSMGLVTSKGKDFNQLSDFGIYERGIRNPSRNMLAYIVSVLEERRAELQSISRDVDALNVFREILDIKGQLKTGRGTRSFLRDTEIIGKQYKAWSGGRYFPKIKDGSPYIRLLYAAGRIKRLDKRTELQGRIGRIITAMRITNFELRRAGVNPATVNPQKLLSLIDYMDRKWKCAASSFGKIDMLKQLLQANIAFDKIKSISHVKKPQWVYDICTENGNFIAGDYGALISHNTSIAALIVAHSLDRHPDKKILILAPTKPLSSQHLGTFRQFIRNDINLVLCTGEVAPEKRHELYDQADVIFSTPQTIKNDLQNNRISLENFSLCVFDEAHRAVKDYAYTYIAEKLPQTTLILGLTASPGGRRERINDVLNNLKITNVEIRGQDDADVSPYVQKSTITWVPVDLSGHFRALKSELDALTGKHAQRLAGMGFPPPLRHKGNFLALGERIRNIPHNIKFPALVQYYALLHLLHMTELLETQGIYPLREYIAKLEAKEGKSAKLLLNEPGMAKVKELCLKDEDHPKMKVLVETVKRLSGAGKKMIVFVQYRSQIARIEDVLRANGISAKRFVGKKEGVTRKMQEETIAEFRAGKFDAMVASSIGEEGLDIPAVDAVIFYEPVPSEIRTIQRRGRAARLKEGEVIVLMTKGTRDEYYHYASQNREKRMKSILHGMKRAGEIAGGRAQAFVPADTMAGRARRHDDSFVVADELKKTAKPKPKEGQMKMTDF